jgi:hypothetical protein
LAAYQIPLYFRGWIEQNALITILLFCGFLIDNLLFERLRISGRIFVPFVTFGRVERQKFKTTRRKEITMGLDLRIFGDGELNELFIEWLVDHQAGENIRRFGRLWEYYSNPTTETAVEGECDSARGYRQAQEMGLPARITGAIPCGNFEQVGLRRAPQIQRKEVVIENDIAAGQRHGGFSVWQGRQVGQPVAGAVETQNY